MHHDGLIRPAGIPLIIHPHKAENQHGFLFPFVDVIAGLDAINRFDQLINLPRNKLAM